MRFDFLTPRIERLSSDGTIRVVSPGSILGRLVQRPVLLLARDLCSFSLFEAAALPKTKRRQAAMLHAQTVAPYVQAKSLLAKANNGFGIWWWDTERVDRLIPADIAKTRPQICPETLAQPSPHSADEHWRIVRLGEGYEAQIWRNKTLVASSWQPHRFEKAEWASFVRLQRSVDQAPSQPPAPSDLPVRFDPNLVRTPVALTKEQMGLLAGAGVMTASLGFAAYLSGQAMEVRKQVEIVESETAFIRQTTPRPTAVENLGTAQKILVAYQELEASTNPLSSAGAAIGILAYHDISPISVRSEVDSLSLVIGYGYLGQAVLLVDDLKNSGYFYDIEPVADRGAQTLTFEMKIREAAPPLTSLN